MYLETRTVFVKREDPIQNALCNRTIYKRLFLMGNRLFQVIDLQSFDYISVFLGIVGKEFKSSVSLAGFFKMSGRFPGPCFGVFLRHRFSSQASSW